MLASIFTNACFSGLSFSPSRLVWSMRKRLPFCVISARPMICPRLSLKPLVRIDRGQGRANAQIGSVRHG